ncbi:MAG TPA: hypothetical protein VKI65_07060 [Gemmataceae bacterium]|nr:hypothetical protein [Gemmataceae bacterium]
MQSASLNLLQRTTCPHCWSSFGPEAVLWISAHADLLGDPRLGPEQPQRFLPTRFTIEGDAIDARGFVSQALACPKCHLPVPRVLLEVEPTFISILGSPACGKSFFLTALTWHLRRLADQFALVFADADTVSNRSLNEYEESLFLNSRADELIPLADLIRKTELQGDLYDTVMFGNQTVSYPRPFLFTVRPTDHHPKYTAARVGRVLCLYDNAGEHFRPGQDTTGSPVTRHMAQARLLLFLFDPTQDQRFQKLCRERISDGDQAFEGRTSRQELVLDEVAARVRRVLGLPQDAKHTQPLIVVLTKLDAWTGLLADKDWSDPFLLHAGLTGVDLERIEARSRAVRELMLQGCAELVRSAEAFARDVIYVPVSALGKTPLSAGPGNARTIRPRDIRPLWVTVPLLYGMCRWMPGLVPAVKRLRRHDALSQAAKVTKTSREPAGRTVFD